MPDFTGKDQHETERRKMQSKTTLSSPENKGIGVLALFKEKTQRNS